MVNTRRNNWSGVQHNLEDPEGPEFTLPPQEESSEDESESEESVDENDGQNPHGAGLLTQSAAESLLFLCGTKQEDTEEDAKSRTTQDDDLELRVSDELPDNLVVIDSSTTTTRGITPTPPPTPLQSSQSAPVIGSNTTAPLGEGYDERLMAKAVYLQEKFNIVNFETALAMAARALVDYSPTAAPPVAAPTAAPPTAAVDRAFALACQLHQEDGEGLGFTEEELRSYKNCDRSSTKKSMTRDTTTRKSASSIVSVITVGTTCHRFLRKSRNDMTHSSFLKITPSTTLLEARKMKGNARFSTRVCVLSHSSLSVLVVSKRGNHLNQSPLIMS